MVFRRLIALKKFEMVLKKLIAMKKATMVWQKELRMVLKKLSPDTCCTGPHRQVLYMYSLSTVDPFTKS